MNQRDWRPGAQTGGPMLTGLLPDEPSPEAHYRQPPSPHGPITASATTGSPITTKPINLQAHNREYTNRVTSLWAGKPITGKPVCVALATQIAAWPITT